MLQVDSVTLRGDTGLQIRLQRHSKGVEIIQPLLDASIGIIERDALPGEIVERVMPLLFGEKWDACDTILFRDEEVRKVVYEIGRML